MRHELDPGRRRRAYLAGQRAEWLALLWLALKGYRPLARRFAIRGGEVDLVVRRGRTIAFVEVKMRPTLDEAVAAVTALKIRRVERAAGVWLVQHPWAAACTLRGDILALGPRRWPRHLPGALPIVVGH